jgi:hypothetical protein
MIAKLVAVDLLGSVVWFPFWWYTKGLSMVGAHALNALRYRAQSYAFVLWLKNFFTPMYGQHDWVGRLVSVFMRLVVFIGRLVAFVVEALIYGVGLILWMLAPAGLAAFTVYSFFAGVTLSMYG